jgi:hypothetical protein
MSLQAEQDSNAQGYSKANAVSRTVSKSSHLYKNETWDLVDAVELKEVSVETLKDDALPEELKGKSAAEIKKYVLEKKKEREQIQNKIQELSAKRKIYISEQKTDTKNGLENAMTNAIKEQAKKKKYTWN